MIDPVPSPHTVPFDGSFELKQIPTKPPAGAPRESSLERELDERVAALRELQPRLYASASHAVLLVFQAMDAAGKDGTIRAVTSGVNPAGFQSYSFGRPSEEELQHDWLWRVSRQLPARGRIGIFNRSHYEEVLVVRVHPELLRAQGVEGAQVDKDFWEARYESIRDFERHLARSGTLVLKFWLHVSRDEQRRRFLERIEEPASRWKFNAGDVAEREHWDAYMAAYEEALRETSRRWAPWYAIPADDKDYARLVVADVVVRAMRALNLEYPPLDSVTAAQLPQLKARLEADA